MSKHEYYVCPNCGDFLTLVQILEDVGEGSCGMCYCEFNNGKIFNKYKRISRKEWERLKELKTDKTRLEFYVIYFSNKIKLQRGKNATSN